MLATFTGLQITSKIFYQQYRSSENILAREIAALFENKASSYKNNDRSIYPPTVRWEEWPGRLWRSPEDLFSHDSAIGYSSVSTSGTPSHNPVLKGKKKEGNKLRDWFDSVIELVWDSINLQNTVTKFCPLGYKAPPDNSGVSCSGLISWLPREWDCDGHNVFGRIRSHPVQLTNLLANFKSCWQRNEQEVVRWRTLTAFSIWLRGRVL